MFMKFSSYLLKIAVFSQSFALLELAYVAENRCIFAVSRTAKIDLFCCKALSVYSHSHCEN